MYRTLRKLHRNSFADTQKAVLLSHFLASSCSLFLCLPLLSSLLPSPLSLSLSLSLALSLLLLLTARLLGRCPHSVPTPRLRQDAADPYYQGRRACRRNVRPRIHDLERRAKLQHQPVFVGVLRLELQSVRQPSLLSALRRRECVGLHAGRDCRSVPRVPYTGRQFAVRHLASAWDPRPRLPSDCAAGRHARPVPQPRYCPQRHCRDGCRAQIRRRDGRCCPGIAEAAWRFPDQLPHALRIRLSWPPLDPRTLPLRCNPRVVRTGYGSGPAARLGCPSLHCPRWRPVSKKKQVRKGGYRRFGRPLGILGLWRCADTDTVGFMLLISFIMLHVNLRSIFSAVHKKIL